MGIIEDLFKWFIGLFISDETSKQFAEQAEGFMNMVVFSIVPFKYIVLLGIILGAVYLFVLARKNTPSMLRKIVDLSDDIYGVMTFTYNESEDGKKYEMRLKDSCLDKLPVGYNDIGFTPEIKIDEVALLELSNATAPYRVSRSKYNATTIFGKLPYLLGVDYTDLDSLIAQWRTEFRTLTLSGIQSLSIEEKEELSFKFMALTIATNIRSVGKDITLIRSNSFYQKGMLQFNKVKSVLIDEATDTVAKKEEYKKIQKELTPLKSVLARNIVLQDYFQAYTAASLVSSVEINQLGTEVTYMELPVQLGTNENTMMVIVLRPSFERSANKEDVFKSIKKTIKKYQFAIQLKSRFSRFKK